MTDPDFNLYNPKPLLIVLSGPSGAGKDTVLDRMKERNLPFHFVVTATTREKRPNEVEGKDYFFVSFDEFARMIEADELLEYAIVYNDYKGIPKQQVRDALASGMDVVMRIDVQGAATIRKIVPEALLIFLTTESEAALVQRLQARKTETHDRHARSYRGNLFRPTRYLPCAYGINPPTYDQRKINEQSACKSDDAE